jgi:tetraacyldisaccharide 4'-kinase
VWKTPKFWRNFNFISLILLPISLLYYLIFLIRQKITTPYLSAIPVICIGNHIAGGAGKTPTAIAIANYLIGKNYKICFISRGYGGSATGPIFIHSKNAQLFGDEAILLSNIAPIVVAKNRISGLKFINKSGNFDFIICDDGLQNPTFHKDLKILVTDKNITQGNNLLFPSGAIREPLRFIQKKCDIHIEISEQKLIPTNIDKLDNNKKYLAFAGIAYPDKFFNTLKENNFDIIATEIFPDHYYYSDVDIQNLIKQANRLDCALITTAKDMVKIDNKYYSHICKLDVKIELNPNIQLKIDNFTCSINNNNL